MTDRALLSMNDSSLTALLQWAEAGIARYGSAQTGADQDCEWTACDLAMRRHWPPRGGGLAECIAELELNPEEAFVLVLAGLAETRPQITFALHELQHPETGGALSVHLALELINSLFPKSDPRDALDLVNSPLLTRSLLTLEGEGPLPLQNLRIEAPFWSVLNERSRPWPGTHTLSGGERSLLPGSARQALPELARPLLNGQLQTLILRGHPGSGRRLMAQELAGLLAMQPLLTPLRLWQDSEPFRLACRYARWLPVIELELAAGDALHLPPQALAHPAIMVLNPDGAVTGDACQEYLLGLPDQQQRYELWYQALQQESLARQLSGSVLLSGPGIAQLAQSARRYAAQSATPVDAEHVRLARQAHGAERLRLLAQPVLRNVSRDAVVFPPLIEGYLEDMILRAQQRESLWHNLGCTLQASRNSGLRALFVGESGTGKTLAASYLANRLGAPLYRVDLGAVMNKYIGESEKNLGLLLDQAAACDVLLLFDEADSLFGSRTDAKQTGERYANNLTNYLLARIENHPGIVILTTNSRERIDSAFNRRIEVIIDFPLPGFAERQRLWHSHLGTRAPGDDVVRALASHCDLSGGQIRNAVLTAAGTQSADAPIEPRRLVRAIQREYQKLGRSMPGALDNLGK
ncbi:hypothetical protein GCM10011348_02810 [Marinobacterium nitratireducens]|uniref:AAA+ ATPase domain-containing protein n=1 Tax=Marinobacterium nitratireducens TaxID=518897 RepID=A0A917Z8Y8_9GAMM|nr:ATP-binding protein [Marinobacterium nitratireducens]GGO76191.1 hypothetical protein GCM10011348_02810 [Marinobacterium nitratireducens]